MILLNLHSPLHRVAFARHIYGTRAGLCCAMDHGIFRRWPHPIAAVALLSPPPPPPPPPLRVYDRADRVGAQAYAEQLRTAHIKIDELYNEAESKEQARSLMQSSRSKAKLSLHGLRENLLPETPREESEVRMVGRKWLVLEICTYRTVVSREGGAHLGEILQAVCPGKRNESSIV